jgi:hypothetical protein
MSTSIADTAATGVSLGLNKNVKQKKIRAFSGFGLSMLGVLAFALYFYANFTTVVVSGESMQPTFFTGNRLLDRSKTRTSSSSKPVTAISSRGSIGWGAKRWTYLTCRPTGL